jgi:hypothetical protein
MPTMPLTEVQLIALSALVFLQGSIIAGIAGVPVVGAFAALLVGVGFLLVGKKYLYMSFSPIANLGKTLVTVAILLAGANLVLNGLGIAFIDASWASMAAGAGLILGVAGNKL